MKVLIGDHVKCIKCGYTWVVHKEQKKEKMKSCKKCGCSHFEFMGKPDVIGADRMPRKYTCVWFRGTLGNRLREGATRMLGSCQLDGMPIYDMSVCMNCKDWEAR